MHRSKKYRHNVRKMDYEDKKKEGKVIVDFALFYQ